MPNAPSSPVITCDVGSGATVGENEELLFNGGGYAQNTSSIYNQANLIVLAASGTTQQLTLTVLHGTLTMKCTTNTPCPTLTGNGTASLMLTGPVVNINGNMPTLSYWPNANYAGSETLSCSDLDVDNGLSGTLSIAITVVPDSPDVTAPASVSTTQSNSAPYPYPSISFTGANAISISDINAGSYSVVLAVAENFQGITPTHANITTTGGAGTQSLTLTGTLSSINSQLNSLVYLPVQNATEKNDTLNINVTNTTNSTASGAQVNITMLPAVPSGTPNCHCCQSVPPSYPATYTFNLPGMITVPNTDAPAGICEAAGNTQTLYAFGGQQTYEGPNILGPNVTDIQGKTGGWLFNTIPINQNLNCVLNIVAGSAGLTVVFGSGVYPAITGPGQPAGCFTISGQQHCGPINAGYNTLQYSTANWIMGATNVLTLSPSGGSFFNALYVPDKTSACCQNGTGPHGTGYPTITYGVGGGVTWNTTFYCAPGINLAMCGTLTCVPYIWDAYVSGGHVIGPTLLQNGSFVINNPGRGNTTVTLTPGAAVGSCSCPEGNYLCTKFRVSPTADIFIAGVKVFPAGTNYILSGPGVICTSTCIYSTGVAVNGVSYTIYLDAQAGTLTMGGNYVVNGWTCALTGGMTFSGSIKCHCSSNWGGVLVTPVRGS